MAFNLGFEARNFKDKNSSIRIGDHMNQATIKENEATELKNCKICSKPFKPRCVRSVCCGPECSAKNRIHLKGTKKNDSDRPSVKDVQGPHVRLANMFLQMPVFTRTVDRDVKEAS